MKADIGSFLPYQRTPMMATPIFLCALAASAGALERPYECTMNRAENTSCAEKAFKWTKEASADDCCATCASTEGCKAWEWWDKPFPPNTHPNCHLKTETGRAYHKPGSTCGSTEPIPLNPTPAPTAPLPPQPPAKPGSPNIVWFLTDDQDQKLGGSFPSIGGVGPMPKTQALLADKGATATNWFIHTPICCPSRAELVTGRYFHNIKQTGGGCMHINEDVVNNQSFSLYLYEAGYRVGMFGKYLNTNPKTPPAGIEAYMTNGGGEYYAPQFDTQGVEDLAPYFMANGSWHGNRTDYTTSVVGNMSMSWLRKVAGGDRPFFAYIAPKACHEPFSPATWYENYWDPSWPAHEPRPVSWNCSAESRADHPGVIRTQDMISDTCADYITTSYKDRWRALMSVDDLIADVVTFIETQGLADNTYFMYSSDHGFQLGEFNILIDKRHVYDHDTRIHNLIRGPGIQPGAQFPWLGTNVDQAPTWLGLAGVTQPKIMDGRSYAPLLIDGDDDAVPAQTRAHIKAVAPNGKAAYQSAWRDSVFIEYYYNSANAKCSGQYPTESAANNFIGIRHLEGSEFGDTLYAEYQTGNQNEAPYGINFTRVDFVEYYNLTADTWQMNNLANASTTREAQDKLKKKLHQWFECVGDECP